MQNLTCLIPLYRSWRFRKVIIANIDAHLNNGASVIVSDKHLFDKTIHFLEQRYEGNDKIQFIASNDEGDWVDNINGLIANVNTDFFRIIPHDDTASATSSQLLLDALDANPDAILATGVVHAKNLFNFRVKKRDELNEGELDAPSTWTLNDASSFYWKSRFAGSFKGVIRTKSIQDKQLFIKKTPTLVHSERTWLFGLALIGRFCFVPDSVLVKRYYSNSTQKSWRYSKKTTIEAAITMGKYCDELLNDSDSVKFNLYLNALEQVRPTKNEFQHIPLTETD